MQLVSLNQFQPIDVNVKKVMKRLQLELRTFLLLTTRERAYFLSNISTYVDVES